MVKCSDKQLPGRVDLVCGAASGADTICPVYVGTCGYSYTEWVDCGFYPPGTRTTEMLDLYSRCFTLVELNYTWYQMARADAIGRMVAKAPPHLLFSAKLTRTMTHEVGTDWQQQVAQFRLGIAPLGKRLVAVLVQFPPDFDRSVAHRKYLASLLDALQGLPVAVEFRHRSWAVDAVFTELQRRRVILVAVDEPALADLFPTLDVLTEPSLFYLRLHGRNSRGWQSSNMQKKFNYDYSGEELHRLCERYVLPMARRAERGIVVFNNHVRAMAPRNGKTLVQLLEEQGGG